MFGLIPMKSIARSSGVKIDKSIIQNIGNISGLYREEHAANTLSFLYCDTRICKTFKGNSWCRTLNQSNYLFVTNGDRTIKLYCDETGSEQTIRLTPENVYRNGKMYYGSPAMIWFDHSIYHYSVSGVMGSSSIHITEFDDFPHVSFNTLQEVKPMHSHYVGELINLP